MKNNLKINTLYISYDGILEPLGDSQVLSYLEKFPSIYKIHLFTFEKKENKNNNLLKILNRISKNDIYWIKKKYLNSPKFLGTIFNILQGMIISFYIIFIKKIKIVHVRSYIPAIMIYFLKKFMNFKLIFDMRGFWADEKIDRVGWRKKDLKYKFFKFFEKKILYNSDEIICLTLDSSLILKKKYPFIYDKNISIIPTCADENYFKPIIQTKKNKILTFGYLGSTEYAYNIDKILMLFSSFLKIDNNLQLLIFNKNLNNILVERIKKFNLPNNKIIVNFYDKENLNIAINKIDVGLFFANENYSIKASFPTKIAELLLSGKPILCNNINNDVKNLISKNKIGLIHNFNNLNYYDLLKKVKYIAYKKNISNKCRSIAMKKLSLNYGLSIYNKIYKEII
tara:strand:+ start:370 stop:1560 length:1191 start_codon:yes stop_codon:yes gene_type:complete